MSRVKEIYDKAKADDMIIYEDLVCFAVLCDASLGHMKVYPQKEYRYMSDFSDDDLEHIFIVASYGATMGFEAFKAAGTNIVQNSLDDVFCLDVVPRYQDDGITLGWDATEPSPDELATTADKIQEAHAEGATLGAGDADTGSSVAAESGDGGIDSTGKEESRSSASKNSDDQWQEKYFRRIP